MTHSTPFTFQPTRCPLCLAAWDPSNGRCSRRCSDAGVDRADDASEPLSNPYKLDDIADQLSDNPGELPAVEPILRAMPLPTERVTEQLNAAAAKHAEVGFTHCFLLMVRKDGESITTSMFYAPDQRTSEIIGVLECAKFDLMFDAKAELDKEA